MTPAMTASLSRLSRLIDADRDHLVRLRADLPVCHLAPTVYGHAVPDWHGRVLDVTDRAVRVLADAPDAAPNSDGATLCPDRVDALGLDLASGYLTHDALYAEMDRMAEDPAWRDAGWTRAELRRLADDLLGLIVAHLSAELRGWRRAGGNLLARTMRTAVRLLGGLWHASLWLLSLSALLLSCALPPESAIVERWDLPPDGPDYVVEPLSPPAAPPAPAPEVLPPAAPAAAEPAEPLPWSSLLWDHGGVRAPSASLVPGARISSLRIASSSLSYRWEAGGCELLGATSRDDYSHTLACAWYLGPDGRWHGGKFDWISTSRTSRDLKNVAERYHGWDPDAWRAAARRAFCIVSADGRRRTNLLVDP